MKITTFITSMLKEETRVNLHGNTIHDLFMPAERYLIDCAEGFTSEGWIQYDTDQDAHYFGVWVNPSKLLTLNYAEGDWTFVVCKDKALYNTHLKSMDECYEKGFIAKCYALDGSMTIYRQDRNECRAS